MCSCSLYSRLLRKAWHQPGAYSYWYKVRQVYWLLGLSIKMEIYQKAFFKHTTLHELFSSCLTLLSTAILATVSASKNFAWHLIEVLQSHKLIRCNLMSVAWHLPAAPCSGFISRTISQLTVNRAARELHWEMVQSHFCRILFGFFTAFWCCLYIP